MRIVQLTNDNREIQLTYHLPEPWFGSAPQALLDGFQTMPEHEIHVVTCTRKSVAAPEKLASNIWFHSLNVPSWGMLKAGYLPCVLAVRKKLREIQPDIVHGQGTERDCSLCAVFSGFPNVLTIHGNMSVHAQRASTATPYYKIAARLEKLCLQRTHGVVAISEYTRELVEKHTRKHWLLPNAVDPNFFDLTAKKSSLPGFLFVGSLCERKSPLLLLSILAPRLSSNECSVTFAGEGDPQNEYYAEFRELASKLPNVHLPGFLTKSQLYEEFERATALILPTLEDNCPMVVLEAQAAGVPVAASAIGGIPDLIEHEKTGLLFDPQIKETIGQAIERLLLSEELRSQLSQAARSHANNTYHPSVVASRHIGIYKEVLDTAGKPFPAEN